MNINKPGGLRSQRRGKRPWDEWSRAIFRSEKSDPLDVTEAVVYLATLAKYLVVHQIVIDRLGADWQTV